MGKHNMHRFPAVTLLLVLSLALLASAQVPLARRDGSWWECPKLQVQPNFNIPRYMGLWYEIDRYWYSFPEYATYCATAQYGLKNNNHVSVNNSARAGGISGIPESFLGDAFAADPREPAKLTVTFDANPAPAPLWILETDYSTYSIMYSCVEALGALPLEFAWIQSRNASLGDDPQLHAKILARAASLGVVTDRFVK